MGVAKIWAGDCAFHYAQSGRRLPNVVRRLANPSLAAALLFRLSSNSHGALHSLLRWTTLAWFASDVAPGVSFLGPIELPHPTGIVIGKGSIVGRNVRIFQHVTLGTSRSGTYPTIGDDVTIYSGAVISGKVSIGSGSIIGANAVITRDVQRNKIIRARDAL